jgi:hypothetical protein
MNSSHQKGNKTPDPLFLGSLLVKEGRSRRAVSRTVVTLFIGLFIIGVGLTAGSLSGISGFSFGSHHTKTTSPPVTSQSVNGSLSLSCSPGRIIVGNSTSCTASLTSYGKPPTGTISWKSNITGIFSPSNKCSISSGSCTISYRPDSAGISSIIGNYTNPQNNQTTTVTYNLPIARAASQTIISSCTSIKLGQTTKCTASVTGHNPTGNVSFSSNGQGSFASTSCGLKAGSCSVQYTPTSPSTQDITASYTGDLDNNASSSPPYPFTPGAGQSTISVSCNPSQVVAGLPTTCTANVTGFSPTGSIGWSDLGAGGSFSPSSTCPLSSVSSSESSCRVSYAASLSASGSVTIQASYSGDGANLPSTGTTQIAVTPVLTKPQISASPNTIDSDQTMNISVSWSGGVPEYTIYLYNGPSPNACSSNNNLVSQQTVSTSSYNFKKISPPSGVSYYCVTVTDSTSNSASSSAQQVTVNPAFTGSPVQISSSSSTIEGGSINLTVQWASAGTSPYTVQLETSSSSSCSGRLSPILSPKTTGGTSAAFQYSPSPGTYNYCATVSDSATPSETSTTSNAAQVTVYAPLSVSISPNPGNTDPYPSYATFTAQVSGGTGSYSYNWNYQSPVYSFPTGCGNGPLCDLTSSANGTYTISVTVSDGVTSQSANAQLCINPGCPTSISMIMPSIFSLNLGTLTEILSLFCVVSILARAKACKLCQEPYRQLLFLKPGFTI